MGMLLSLSLTSCTKDSANDEITTVDPCVLNPNIEKCNPIAPTGTLTPTTGPVGTLSGSYGTGGSFTVTTDGIKFLGDWNGSTAPGPVIFLSNSRTSISNGVNLGPAQKSKGAWDIGTTQALDYEYLIIWCDPFSVYIGGGKIPKD